MIITIIAIWLFIGWLTWRWHKVWGINQFGDVAFDGNWWWLFHLFILAGLIYSICWAGFVVWFWIAEGVDFRGKKKGKVK